MKKSIFIVAVAVAVIACNNTPSGNTSKQAVTTQPTEVASDLYGKEWKLLELNGKAIVLDTTFPRYPYLIFEKENNRVIGNGGCNGLSGSFELKGKDSLEVSHVATTQMACPNLELEQQFLDVLKNVKRYYLEENILILSNESNDINAKFETSMN